MTAVDPGAGPAGTQRGEVEGEPAVVEVVVGRESCMSPSVPASPPTSRGPPERFLEIREFDRQASSGSNR